MARRQAGEACRAVAPVACGEAPPSLLPHALVAMRHRAAGRAMRMRRTASEDGRELFGNSEDAPRQRPAKRIAGASRALVPRAPAQTDGIDLPNMQASDAHSQPAVGSLIELPDEVLAHIAALLLRSDLPAALRLCSTSAFLHVALCQVREAACRQKLLLSADLTVEGEPAGESVGSMRRLEVAPDTDGFAWAAGHPLPREGKSAWSVRIEHCVDENKNMGCVQIGVCDAGNSVAWSIMPYNGRLLRSYIGTCGRQGEARQRLWRRTSASSNEALPPGLPDGHDRQALVDTNGRPTNLQRRASGAVIQVVVDADAGTLGFGWNETAPRVVLHGFPRSCALRPWICVPGWCGGRLAISPFFHHTPRQ